jgi:hypothetical protein
MPLQKLLFPPPMTDTLRGALGQIWFASGLWRLGRPGHKEVYYAATPDPAALPFILPSDDWCRASDIPQGCDHPGLRVCGGQRLETVNRARGRRPTDA